MWNTISRRTTHPTYFMCSTSWSKRSRVPWRPKSGPPSRQSPKPQRSSNCYKAIHKARVMSPKSTFQDAPQRNPCAWSTPSKCSQRPVVSTSVSRSNVNRGKASIRGIGHDYHFVDLERGVRRNGHLIASDIQGHIEQIRTVAQQEALSQSCLERINKAERVVPKMQATIAFVSRYVGQQVAQLDLTPPASFAMHAKLIPSYYLDRVAGTRTVSDGDPRELAERLRAPLVEPGGVLSALSPEAQHHLHDGPSDSPPCSSARVPMWRGETATCPCAAINFADSICRASECFTAIHNFFLTRPDGTTAAERFFGQKPRSMFAAILDGGAGACASESTSKSIKWPIP